MKKLFIFLLLIMPLIGSGSNGFNTVALSLANSAGASLRGTGASLVNPALMGMPCDFRSEMTLLNGEFNLANNAFSNSNYLKYFASGDYISSADKKDIMNLLESGSLDLFTDENLSLLSVYSNNIAVNLYFSGSGKVSIPDDFFDLLLYGNELNALYKFSDAGGEAWAGLTAAVSYSYRMEYYSGTYVPFLGDIDYWAWGATIKYIRGIAYGHMTSVSASIVTFDDYIQGVYQGKGYVSQGGNGYGVDLGTSISFEESTWVFSLGINNVLGGINWNKDNHLFTMTGTIDSVSLSNIDETEPEFEDSDTTYKAFYTYLPTVIDLGVAFKLNGDWLFTFEYEQNLRKTMGIDRTPKIGVGAEMTYLKELPVRAGISIGGRYGLTLGTGFGINFEHWVWDFALANHGGFFGNSAKGFSLATGMSFRW